MILNLSVLVTSAICKLVCVFMVCMTGVGGGEV